VWDVQNDEKIRFTYNFIQWLVSDAWQRPLYRIDTGGGPEYPSNYIYNKSVCPPFLGCGQIKLDPNYLPLDEDIAYSEKLPIPAEMTKAWTVLEVVKGSGSLLTVMVQGQILPSEQFLPIRVATCPATGCWQPPPAPPLVMEKTMFLWSDPATWDGTQDHPSNPLNTLLPIFVSKGNYEYHVMSWQNWTEMVPGSGDNVWIPPWTKVCYHYACLSGIPDDT
jgi:hypothetical protein